MIGPARPEKRLYSLKEAAGYLARGLHGIRDLVWTGQLPVVKAPGGRKLFIDVRDLDSFIERQKITFEKDSDGGLRKTNDSRRLD